MSTIESEVNPVPEGHWFLFVTDVSGQFVTFYVNETTTVLAVKEAVLEDPDMGRLVFAGKVLGDDEKVGVFGTEDRCMHILARLGCKTLLFGESLVRAGPMRLD